MCPRVRVQQFNQVTSNSPALRFQNSLYNWCRWERFCNDTAPLGCPPQPHPPVAGLQLLLHGLAGAAVCLANPSPRRGQRFSLENRELAKKLLSNPRIQEQGCPQKKCLSVFQGSATEAWIASFSKGSNLCHMHVPVESGCSGEQRAKRGAILLIARWRSKWTKEYCEEPSAM